MIYASQKSFVLDILMAEERERERKLFHYLGAYFGGRLSFKMSPRVEVQRCSIKSQAAFVSFSSTCDLNVAL